MKIRLPEAASVEVALPPSTNHLYATSRGRRIPEASVSKLWTKEEVDYLKSTYPLVGKHASAVALGRTPAEIRSKAWRLGLKLDRNGPFFKDFQARAAQAHVGKKRPAQAEVMRNLHKTGKLRRTPEQNAAMGQRTKKYFAEHGHPLGFKGHKHTDATKAKCGEASREMFAKMTAADKRKMRLVRSKARTNRVNPNRGSWKAGWRKIGGKRRYFRSRWEANYARFLEFRKSRGEIADWEHEPDTFWFEKVRRGAVSYLPDFKVTNVDASIEYHEVKGWMDARSKTQLKRMKKYHPSVQLVVVDSKSYKRLAALVFKTIDGWEF